jgi:hypothetical protein
MLRSFAAAVVATAAFAFPAAAQDAPPSASETLTILYENLAVPESGCPIYTTEAGVLYFFTPELLMEYKKAGSVDFPVIQADVFLDAQDVVPVTGLTAKPIEEDATTANVEVSFKLGGEDRKLVYTMKKAGSRWLIDDITYASREGAGTLRAEITAGLADAAAMGATP